MAWSTLDIGGEEIYLDGTGAFNFIASGTIYTGQAVCICDNKTVKVTTSITSYCDAIGVASINSTDTRRVGVFGYGNVVKCCTDSDYSVSTLLYATDDGLLTSTKGNAKKVAGIIYEQPVLGTVNYVGTVMLL